MLKPSLGLATLALLLVPSLARAAPVAAGHEPLLVVIEGYSACQETPNDPSRVLWGPATDQLTKLTTGLEAVQGHAPRVIYACFGFVDSGWLKFLGPIDLRWTDSREPAVVHRATFEQPFADRIEDDAHSGRTPAPLAALELAVRDEIQTAPAAPVYVVGHSYGGWTAMQLVLALNQPITGLVTVDPISPVGCNLGTIFSGHFDTPDACRQFPADVTDAQRGQLARLAQTWSHFYQDQYEWIHSGFVSEAGTSERLTVQGTDQFAKSAHNRIIMDDRVWAGVRSLMTP